MMIKKSTRPSKDLMVKVNGKVIHFGSSEYKEYPGTKRGDNYCTRSLGIKNQRGELTAFDKNSANYWSRKILWNCKGKKSIKN